MRTMVIGLFLALFSSVAFAGSQDIDTLAILYKDNPKIYVGQDVSMVRFEMAPTGTKYTGVMYTWGKGMTALEIDFVRDDGVYAVADAGADGGPDVAFNMKTKKMARKAIREELFARYSGLIGDKIRKGGGLGKLNKP